MLHQELTIVILAAGQGKRMCTDLPKVLHPLAGTSLLERIIHTAQTLKPSNIIVVYGNGGHEISKKLSHLPVTWVLQEKPQGTGHAVKQALPPIKDNQTVLVLYGDVPLISVDTLKNLLTNAPKNALGLVIAEFKNPTGFGRIIRNELGNIIAVIEEKDANVYERKIREINTGIITTSVENLRRWLPRLSPKNAQQEYYLTDIVTFAAEEGCSVTGVIAPSPEEVRGVNNLFELAKLERLYQRQQAERLMRQGITLLDPNRFDLRGELSAGSDVVIDINVIIEGKVKIGKRSKIGANCILKNSTIADDVIIAPNSIVENSKVNGGAVVGPFARLRPNTTVGKNARVGNFVEVKNTTIGEDSKACHLSYLGDTKIGKAVNIGAGTITCNYDGANKYTTKIEDDVFIGSGTQLVAPVTISRSSTIGAGSTITGNTPPEKLTLARARQQTIENWKRPTKKEES